MSDEDNLPLGQSFLGLLNSKLRDLQGFPTLAYELIQNAEDAISEIPNPSSQQATLVFRVDENALVVENGAVFSDCGSMKDAVCPWAKDGSRPCDFHGFRMIGAGEKRRASKKFKGAFGFGFTAVYQITDHPELISRGRHWIIHIEEDERNRIQPCKDPNCVCKTQTDLPGTRFILPWATCQSSVVRKALTAEAVRSDAPSEVLKTLRSEMPRAILFLDHIRTIEVYWKSELIVRVSLDKTLESMPSFTVTVDGVPMKWLLLSHDFEEVAKNLRRNHPSGEKHPESIVSIAIPEFGMGQGSIYSFLPTQDSTNAPFHINADFFPSTNRKRILMEKDYQGDWNRAAITAGAITLRDGLLSLREHLGPAGFWDLLQKLRQNSSYPDSLLGSQYWTHTATVLQSQPVVPVVPIDSDSSKLEWLPAAEARLVPESDGAKNLELLRELRIRAVHPDVLGHQEFLASEQVGVRWLSSTDLASQLDERGFEGTKSQEELPKWFRTLPNIRLLWKLIGSVTSRELNAPKTKPAVAPNPLSACSILECTDGKFRPWLIPYKTDPETRTLFQPLNSDLYFATDDPDMLAALERHIQTFKLPDAISAIAACIRQETANTASNIQAGKVLTKDVALGLLKWFNNKSTVLAKLPSQMVELKKLAICPIADGLKSFDEVVLPGEFDDPIGITSVADVAALNTVPELRKLLNLKELHLRDYLTKWLPQAFRNKTVTVDECGKLLKMLSKHQQSIDILTDANEVRTALRKLRFVPCSDGELRSVDDGLYFDTPLIRGILSHTVSYVDKAYCSTGVDSLLKWLGVEDQARLRNVVDYMLNVAQPNSCPTEAAIKILVTSLEHLNSRILEVERQAELLKRLKCGKWVPAEFSHWDVEKKQPVPHKEWCVPSNVCFLDTRHLVETTGRWLLFSDEVQKSCRALLELLGVKSKPDVEDVIKHLQRSAQTKSPVDSRVYQFINEALEKDKALAAKLQDLKTSECLFDVTRKCFFSPTRCFSKSHPFGTFREVLRNEPLGTLIHLLSALEVRETPEWQDAVDVIRDISIHESVTLRPPVTEELKGILNSCWRLIGKAIRDKPSCSDAIEMRLQEFSNLPVVCGHNNIMVSPRRVFFRDREKYAEAFSPSLDAILIPMSPRDARALEMAGVRKLSQSTSFQIIQDDQSRREGTFVSSRLQERASLLINLIEWANPKRRHGRLPDFNSMKVFQSSSLKVEFTFCGSDKPQKVDKEVLAAFDDSRNTLWYCLEDGRTPWDAIAFEISRTYVNDDEIAHLSAAVSVALEPDSVMKARKKLCQLGFPNTDVCDAEPVVPETSQLTCGNRMTVAEEISTDSKSHGAILQPRPQGQNEVITVLARPQTSCEFATVADHERTTDGMWPHGSTKDVDPNIPDFTNEEGVYAATVADTVHHLDMLEKAPKASTPDNELILIEGDDHFTEFLTKQPGASDKRNLKTLFNSSKAPPRRSEVLPRSERIDRIPRSEVLQYLTTFYTDGDLLKCQMAMEDEDMHYMPFWKSHDQMYAGKMELFNREFSQLHCIKFPEVVQLHLLLCPNCAAIYTRFVATKPKQQERLYDWVNSASTGNSFTIECSLAGKQPNRVLHFSKKHLDDIRNTYRVFVDPNTEQH
jgi:hypothetical protein